MEPGSLMHLKHMQIRKPLLKSLLADPNMTEEEVNMKYVQDLLNWVEEMQVSSFSILHFKNDKCSGTKWVILWIKAPAREVRVGL